MGCWLYCHCGDLASSTISFRAAAAFVPAMKRLAVQGVGGSKGYETTKGPAAFVLCFSVGFCVPPYHALTGIYLPLLCLRAMCSFRRSSPRFSNASLSNASSFSRSSSALRFIADMMSIASFSFFADLAAR